MEISIRASREEGKELRNEMQVEAKAAEPMKAAAQEELRLLWELESRSELTPESCGATLLK